MSLKYGVAGGLGGPQYHDTPCLVSGHTPLEAYAMPSPTPTAQRGVSAAWWALYAATAWRSNHCHRLIYIYLICFDNPDYYNNQDLLDKSLISKGFLFLSFGSKAGQSIWLTTELFISSIVILSITMLYNLINVKTRWPTYVLLINHQPCCIVLRLRLGKRSRTKGIPTLPSLFQSPFPSTLQSLFTLFNYHPTETDY